MRQILLGQAPLGQGGAVGSNPRFLGPPYYLINDTFTTDRAAGSVNGTDAEPGPGRRTVVDNSNVLSLSGGAAICASGASNDPRVGYERVAVERGRMYIAEIMPGSTNINVGFGAGNNANNVANIMTFISGGIVNALLSASVNVASYSTGVLYRICMIQRMPGYFFFIWNDVTEIWQLLAHSFSYGTSGQALFPSFGARGSTTMDVRGFRIPSAKWMPTPLASDGFGAWGTTDGLGHQEGVAGGLGSGGSGDAWTSNVGAWGASGGVAQASALSGGIAIATVDTSTADVLATVKATRSAGNVGLVVRYADANNYVYALHNGTNAQLVKVVAGTPTTLVNTAAAYSAGADLRVICEGTKFRLHYNNVFIGSEQTISDAGLASGTAQGLYTTDTGNAFDDFIVYARGTGGEHAALDDF
ncbi:MAG TPA: hypothetical protein PKA43_00170 [Candidatus Competibacter phosphatis]|nr:hypothetical protein [Candidatus Competibacter phosphatis]